MTPIGTARMASVEPCVFRSTWNETALITPPHHQVVSEIALDLELIERNQRASQRVPQAMGVCTDAVRLLQPMVRKVKGWQDRVGDVLLFDQRHLQSGNSVPILLRMPVEQVQFFFKSGGIAVILANQVGNDE